MVSVAGRASIVGAAVTHVGNVREHNEDAHFFDADLGLFLVCDGMGGHAAGEVASAIAIKTIREKWADPEMLEVADVWLARGTAIAKKQLLDWLRDGVISAHQAIIGEAERDSAKSGMGTTLVGAMVVGTELVFAHAGDSRAYIVRDNIAMQLTEDHTLLSRLLAAGIDVVANDLEVWMVEQGDDVLARARVEVVGADDVVQGPSRRERACCRGRARRRR